MKKADQEFLIKLKKALEAEVANQLKKVLESDLYVKVNNSSVLHEPLVPEGDKYKVHIEVTVYPKKEKAPS